MMAVLPFGGQVLQVVVDAREEEPLDLVSQLTGLGQGRRGVGSLADGQSANFVLLI